MNSSVLLSVITFVYAFSAVLYISMWIFKKDLPGKLATWVAGIGCAGNMTGIILRWIESANKGYGHAPLSNLYESLMFFAWAIVFIYLIVEYRSKNRSIGAFVMPIAFLAMAYASLSPNISDRIQPLIPALKSNWLIAHVITCFLGYAGFAIAFGISIMYIYRQVELDSLNKKYKADYILTIAGCLIIWFFRQGFQENILKYVHGIFGRLSEIKIFIVSYITFVGEKMVHAVSELSGNSFGILAIVIFSLGLQLVFWLFIRHRQQLVLLLPETGILDDLTHKMVQFGFLFLSVGIITGAVWANSAWGRYWGWDPKETWSLITWFIYAGLLHARLMRGWHGKKIACISIVGFLAVLFTYFGVNLLPGLHSYGSQ